MLVQIRGRRSHSHDTAPLRLCLLRQIAERRTQDRSPLRLCEPRLRPDMGKTRRPLGNESALRQNIMKIYSGLASKAHSGGKVQFIEVNIPDDLLDGDEIDYSDLDYAHDVDTPEISVADDDIFN